MTVETGYRGFECECIDGEWELYGYGSFYDGDEADEYIHVFDCKPTEAEVQAVIIAWRNAAE